MTPPLLSWLIGTLSFSCIAFHFSLAPERIWQCALVMTAASMAAWRYRRLYRGVLAGLLLGLCGAGWSAYWMRHAMQQPPPKAPTEIHGVVLEADTRRIVMRAIEDQRLYRIGRHAHDRLGDAAALVGRELRCRLRHASQRRATVPGGWDARLHALEKSSQPSYQLQRCRRINAGLDHAPPPPHTRYRAAILRLMQRELRPQIAAILAAMLLGKADGLDEPTQRLFRFTGLTHTLVVSGSNLAMLGLAAYLLVKLLLGCYAPLLLRYDSQILASCLAGLLMAFYLLLVGAEPPLLRAYAAALLLLLAVVCRRPFVPLHALMVAALALLLWNPFYLFSVSFQLTMSATFGILWGLQERGSGLLHVLSMPRSRVCRCGGILLLSAWATVCAWLFTLPVLWWHFHQLSLWAVLCNLLYAPIIGTFVMPAGFLAMAAQPLSQPAAAGLFKFAGFWLEGILTHLGFWSELPGAAVNIAAPLPLQLAGWYLLCFALVRARLVGRVVLLAAALALFSAGWLWQSLPWSPRLRGAVLDVGDALAVVLELQSKPWDRQVLVVDTGGAASCAWALLPYLRQRGIRRIDALYLSHWDADHVGCLSQLSQEFTIMRRFASYLPEPPVRESARILTLGAKHHWLRGHLQLTVLHPQRPRAVQGDNNRSLVLWGRFQAVPSGKPFDFLLPGDIEKPVEPAVAAQWRQRVGRPVDLLVAPHHGSRTSSTPALVQALRPAETAISRRRPPGKGVWQRYQQAGSRLWWTRRHGTLLFDAGVAGFAIRGYTCRADGSPYNGWGICP